MYNGKAKKRITLRKKSQFGWKFHLIQLEKDLLNK